jgi:Triosephosphate isomerase
MGAVTKFFIGNWKMFGIPSSFKIIDRINQYFEKDKKNNKKYKIIMAPPFTLLQNFSKKYKNKKIFISAQNCYHKDHYGSYTGKVSPFMIKKMGVNYVIIGHSENRASGENEKIIQEKVSLAFSHNFNIIFCIGENKMQKRAKKTLSFLKRQLSKD